MLGYLAEYAADKFHDEEMAQEALTLKKEIEMGIDSYAVRNLEGIGETYVYETDGYGNDVWMDDANVPNLLSMPWLGWCDASDERYQNTRKWVLSSKNPFIMKEVRQREWEVRIHLLVTSGTLRLQCRDLHQMMRERRQVLCRRFLRLMQEHALCMKDLTAMIQQHLQESGLHGQIHYLHYMQWSIVD